MWLIEKHFEHSLDPRRELRPVWLGSCRRRAERDAPRAEEGCLLGRRQCPGVPDAVSDVRSEIEPREHEIELLPEEGAEGDAIGGSAIDTVRLERLEDRGATVRQRPRMGD